MEIGEQRKLKAAIQARQEIAEVIAMLDRHDPDIELDGGPALWKAVHGAHLEVVKLLVEAGADPFAPVRDSMSIYEAARTIGRSEIVAYFDTLKA